MCITLRVKHIHTSFNQFFLVLVTDQVRQVAEHHDFLEAISVGLPLIFFVGDLK